MSHFKELLLDRSKCYKISLQESAQFHFSKKNKKKSSQNPVHSQDISSVSATVLTEVCQSAKTRSWTRWTISKADTAEGSPHLVATFSLEISTQKASTPLLHSLVWQAFVTRCLQQTHRFPLECSSAGTETPWRLVVPLVKIPHISLTWFFLFLTWKKKN